MARRLPARADRVGLAAGMPGAVATNAVFGGTFTARDVFFRQAIRTVVSFRDRAEMDERIRLRRQSVELTNDAARRLQGAQADLAEDPNFETHNEKFEAQRERIRQEIVGRADPRIAPDIELKLERLGDNAQFNVRAATRKREIDAGRAAIVESGNLYSRQAAAAPTAVQRDLAVQAFEEDLADATNDGFFSAQEATVQRQQFRERVDLIGALELVNRSPKTAASVLEDPKAFPDLDPLRREQLRAQADRAARADNDVGIERARDYVAALEAGAIQDEGREQAIVGLIGSDKEAAKFGDAVARAIFVRDETKDLKFRPPAEQAAGLAKLRQDPNAKSFSADRQEDLARIAKNLVIANQQKAEDPRAFVQPLVAEDLKRYEDQGLMIGEDEERVATTLALRHQRAVGVARPLPLSNAEAAGEAQALEQLDASQAAARLGQIIQSKGPDATDQIAAQLRGRRPHLSLAATHAGQGPAGLRLAEEIIDGQRILADNKDLAPSATEAQQNFGEVYPSLFDAAPEARAPFMAATAAIYAMSIAGTDGTFDPSLYRQAARRAGGAVVTADGELKGGPFQHNGRTVLPVAPGMGEDETLGALASLDDETAALYGNGAPVDGTGAPVSAADIKRHGELVSFGFGRYMVQFEGRAVFAAGTRDVYTLDLGRLVSDRPAVIGRAAPPSGGTLTQPGGRQGTPELLP